MPPENQQQQEGGSQSIQQLIAEIQQTLQNLLGQQGSFGGSGGSSGGGQQFQQPQLQQIQIPQGATLSSLAQQHGTTVEQLLQLNPQIQNPNMIFAGATLNLPGGQQQQQQLSLPDPQQLQQVFNQESQQIFDGIPEGSTESEADAFLKMILGTFKQGSAPEAPNLQEMFLAERKKLGLDPLETRLAELQTREEQLQTAFNRQVEGVQTEAGLTEAQSNARVREMQRVHQREMADLALEKNAVARQVDSKLKAIEMTMGFAQTDFQNASKQYEQNFSRQMQMLDLFFKVEDRETKAQDRLQKNAEANLNTITTLMRDSGTSFENLTPEQLSEVRRWELEAGLPSGTYENLFRTNQSDKMLTSGSRTASGQTFFDVLWERPDGSRYFESIPRGASGSVTPEDTQFNLKNIPGELRSEIVKNISAGASLSQLIEFYPDVEFDALNKIWQETR